MTYCRMVKLFALLAALLMLSCSGPEEKKMKFFERGKTLYEQGDYVKARLEFKNSLQLDPKFAEAYYMLGLVALKDLLRSGIV